MKVLLIRHGRAEERAAQSLSARADAARALTESGRRDMRKAAKGLRRIAPDIDLLASSPFVRAQETAAIVARVFGVRDVVDQSLLVPGRDALALFDWLAQQPADATVALVGHEPGLSRLASMLVYGEAGSGIEIKKGASVLIEFNGRPAVGRGTLLWSLPPAVLRRIPKER